MRPRGGRRGLEGGCTIVTIPCADHRPPHGLQRVGLRRGRTRLRAPWTCAWGACGLRVLLLVQRVRCMGRRARLARSKVRTRSTKTSTSCTSMTRPPSSISLAMGAGRARLPLCVSVATATTAMGRQAPRSRRPLRIQIRALLHRAPIVTPILPRSHPLHQPPRLRPRPRRDGAMRQTGAQADGCQHHHHAQKVLLSWRSGPASSARSRTSRRTISGTRTRVTASRGRPTRCSRRRRGG